MGGHRLTFSVAAATVLVAACSFNTSVALETQSDGGTSTGLSPDAAASPDAARGLTADAGPDLSNPDADPGLPPGTLLSTRRTQAITLDGLLDAEWQTLDFVDFAIGNSDLLEAGPNYVADASVRIASMYDVDKIYFFIEVQDDLLVDDSENTYNDDSIELYIDGLNDRSGPLNNDDHWLAIGADNVYASLGPTAVEIGGSIRVTDTGYNIEISFDRADLGAGTSTLLGFNFAINDDDGQGSTAVDAYGLWHVPAAPVCATCCDGFAENYPWCDTTRLGQLQLVP